MKNAIKQMESSMSKKSIERSNQIYNHKILSMKLVELRVAANLTQSDVPGFIQSAVSRIETRSEDIKISTLFKYILALGLDIEISVKPRKQNKDFPDKVILYKSGK